MKEEAAEVQAFEALMVKADAEGFEAAAAAYRSHLKEARWQHLPYNKAVVKELFLSAIGEASMCWSPTPLGRFLSDEARGVAERLQAEFEPFLPRWIPVTGRLPDKDGRVLIYAPAADPNLPLILTAWWDPAQPGWQGIVKVWADAVTHWMPLPSGPAE